uniref:Inosine triphosphate pyrophosphatase n=1 Tax=Encephalitozoon cuniculi TaxID=6035 RepID=M1K7S7_ENCCN|nr:nucleoside triphosphatase [Encephalitozoon cuniculi]
MGRIYFATTNLKKLKEIRSLFEADIVHMNIPMVEIQASLERIADHKLNQVVPCIGEGDAVIVDDTAVAFEGLYGFPGVYIKDFLRIGSRKISEIVGKIGNSNATAFCCLGIAHYRDGRVVKKVFFGELEGSIVESKEDGLEGFDYIFLPSGSSMCLGDMPVDEKNRISHRRIASKKLADYMASVGIIKAHGS